VIEGDLAWRSDDDHSPACEFAADVRSEAGYPLRVRGSYNPLARKLTYVLLHRSDGRIYALDMGTRQRHHNPDCHWVGDKHKHRWTEGAGDKEAYEPQDIMAGVTDPVLVWTQFCAEARIRHDGRLKAPPPGQEVLYA